MNPSTPPKAKPSKALSDIRRHRLGTGDKQTDFWPKYGTKQSTGSRYESGKHVPNALAILIVLQDQGVLSDEQLASALAIVKASKK